MVIYQVNLQIDATIATEYRSWLQQHISEILRLPGFIKANLFESLPNLPTTSFEAEKDASAQLQLCVQYELTSMLDLQNYFDQHAAHFRAQGREKFGDRFSASRQVLRFENSFSRETTTH